MSLKFWKTLTNVKAWTGRKKNYKDEELFKLKLMKPNWELTTGEIDFRLEFRLGFKHFNIKILNKMTKRL